MKYITLTIVLLLAGCAITPPTDEEMEAAAAAARASDRTAGRLQVQDLCWRVYDGEHGCYLPP